MGYESERASIEGRISDNWTVTPIKWPNVAFEPGTASAYIEPWIVNGTSYQASLGRPAIWRHPGSLSINIRVRPQVGMGVAKTYADTLAILFRAWCASGITFGAPRIRQVGDIDGWYLLNLQIPFERDEIF